MRKRKSGFSIVDHEIAGILLHQAHNKIRQLKKKLGGAYSTEIVRVAVEADEAINNLKVLLDLHLHRENPGVKNLSRVYHRGRPSGYFGS